MAVSQNTFIVAWRLVKRLAPLLRRQPALLLLLAAGAGGWYGYEVLVARPTLVYLGEPKVRDWLRPLTWNRTLRNHGFLVGYSELRGNPLWVSYRLTPPPATHKNLRRPGSFRTDWRNLSLISHGDYRDSGYDRGHMAPNHAIAVLYGRSAQLETFLMTNVSPQKAELNRRLWERLEEAELDRFALRQGMVWVLSGPIFDDQVERLTSAWRVEVPDAFYKVYAAPQANQAPSLLAFVIPQQVRGDEPLERYVTSVDKVEKLTGLDFFPQLPEHTAQQIESGVDAGAWDLEAAPRQPSRYGVRKHLESDGKKPH